MFVATKSVTNKSVARCKIYPACVAYTRRTSGWNSERSTWDFCTGGACTSLGRVCSCHLTLRTGNRCGYPAGRGGPYGGCTRILLYKTNHKRNKQQYLQNIFCYEYLAIFCMIWAWILGNGILARNVGFVFILVWHETPRTSSVKQCTRVVIASR